MRIKSTSEWGYKHIQCGDKKHHDVIFLPVCPLPRVFSSRYGPTYSSSLWEWDILPDPPSSSLLPSFHTTMTAATPATPSGPPWGVRHSFMLTAARAARVPLVQWHYPCAPHPNDAAWPLVKCASSRRRVSTHRILIVCCCCCCCHASSLAVQATTTLSLYLSPPPSGILSTHSRSFAYGFLSLLFSTTVCAIPFATQGLYGLLSNRSTRCTSRADSTTTAHNSVAEREEK